jgi:hypothetical protein
MVIRLYNACIIFAVALMVRVCLVMDSYSCFWDFRMDWGLLRNGIRHKYPFLREQLMYPVPVYYVIMVPICLVPLSLSIDNQRLFV